MRKVYRDHAVLLSLLGLWLVFSVGAFAQSDTAQITGFVKDATGAAVPNVTVLVKNEATGLERSTTTNDSGYYVVSSLAPGFYTVSVEAQGFKRFQKTQNKLDPSIPTTVDVTLEVGTLTQTIEVVAAVAHVQSDTATLGKVITSEQIRNMQMNGRNPIFLALLKPGVRGGSGADLNFGLTSGGFTINGARSQDSLITFDGAVAIRTRSNGTSIGVADVDSVQEVQILTANYNAEYGRTSGGQIRIVTKSGTRAFHGDFYEYLRNSALNANTWGRNRTIGNKEISQAPPAERYNQFGYNVNGPIFIPGKFNQDRSKLFFFWGQEWARRRRADTTITTVPSLLMRNGDFSELLNPSNSFYNKAVFIKDPSKTGNCDATDQGACFPGNLIPANRQSANGLAFLRAYPLPTPGFNQGTANFVQQRPTLTDQRKDTVAIDFSLNERQQFRFRHQNYSFVDTSAFRSGTDRAPQIITRPNKTASLNYIFTISPTTVNELLVGASVDRVYIAVDTRGDRFKRSIYGINYPYIFPDRKEIPDKIPTVVLQPPFTDLDGGPYPSSSTGPIYDISDNITKVYNNHTFKFGGLFERSGQNDFDQINVQGVPGGTNNQNGRFVFDDKRTGAPTSGNALGNAALGLFTTYAEIGVRSFTPYRGHMFEWFAQDSWKVTPKLRLEYGIRHSIIQPYYSLWRNMVVFDPRFYDPSKAAVLDSKTGFVVSGDRYNGLVIPGDKFPASAKGRIPIADTGEFDRLFRGVSKQYSDVHYKDFQPRVGFAYAFTPKTVVRGGAGKFITRLGVSDSVFLGGNPPLQPMVSISNGSADSPGGGSSNAFPFNVTTQDPVFQNPMAWTWNLTVERELPGQTILEVGYVGRRGLRGQRERNINQLQPGTLQANPGISPDFLRPFKGFGPIRSTNNEANSTYNGLQVGLNRRFSKGFMYGVAYTFSKSSDDGSNQRDIIPNAFDAHTLWGPSAFDTRHILTINYIYQLPFFRDTSTWSGKLLGGWQITGVTQFQTGTPFTIGSNNDFAGVGDVGQLDGNPSNRQIQIWNVNGNPQLSRGDRAFSFTNSDSNFWFRTKNPDGSPIFTSPAAGTFTTQNNRNILYGPGFQNWNLGLFKNFSISETQRFTFRAEAFNWINHPNWGGTTGGGVDIDPRSATFGKVTGRGSERNLQLSLRYTF